MFPWISDLGSVHQKPKKRFFLNFPTITQLQLNFHLHFPFRWRQYIFDSFEIVRSKVPFRACEELQNFQTNRYPILKAHHTEIHSN